jgi:hypothetical protein
VALVRSSKLQSLVGSSGNGEVHSEPGKLVEAAINAEPVLIFGQLSDSLKAGRRRARPAAPEQQSLFGWN